MDRARSLGLAFVALGFVELAWVAFCVFGGLVLGVMGLVDAEFAQVMLALGGVYGVLALFNLPLALLHVFAGVRLRQGRGLLVALAGLAGCLASMLSALYCTPLSLAVLVYGIVVLADPAVRDALDAPELV